MRKDSRLLFGFFFQNWSNSVFFYFFNWKKICSFVFQKSFFSFSEIVSQNNTIFIQISIENQMEWLSSKMFNALDY